ncbi:hypothetical protein FKK32_29230, partial [Klebsiella pneumoniae]|nr:hypothetical protein [Klebsiella pneumoniae]
MRTELVAEVLEGLPELAAYRSTDSSADAGVAFSVMEAMPSVVQPSAAASVETASADAPTRTAPDTEDTVTLGDPALQQALEAGLATTVLFLPSSGLIAKQTYEAMLLENVRVKVDLPWFVTKDTVLPADAWPRDKRAIGQYWKKLARYPIRLRPERGEAPSVAHFPDWVMRRLAIPQSAYALDMSGLLPTAKRLFNRVDRAYDQYLEEAAKAEADKTSSNFWKDLPELVA